MNIPQYATSAAMKTFPRLVVIAVVSVAASCTSVTHRTAPSAPSLPPPAAAETTEQRDVLELSALNRTLAAERYYLGGEPIPVEPVVTLENTGYAVGFSEELIDPLWVAYYCGPYSTFPNGERLGRFSTDSRVKATARLKHEDYNRPQGSTPTYDRGHMAPNYAIATRYGRAAQLETFLLTNIVPQRSSLNQKTWKALETEIARNFAPACKGVWVTVGPIFKTPIARYNGKAAMPSAFYCIIVDRTASGTLRALALVMEQSVTDKRRIGDFITTIRHIEKRTEINFFAALPDEIEEALETALADKDWNWDLLLDPNKYAGGE